MKYNVLKIKEFENRIEVIEFFGKGLDKRQALSLLRELHSTQKGAMFQDVENIKWLDYLPSFKVDKYGVAYTYKIEVDNFQMFEIFRPVNFFKPENEITHHFNLN
jgi:hypothetical protein